jgi:hypothetical protein
MKVSDEFEQALSSFRQALRTGCWTLLNCGAAKYRCDAFKEGKSCWQYAQTPCCDVNRKRCISCPVFVRLVELPKRKQRVLVTTESLHIEADFHCPVGMRILDALNVEERDFVALTDAQIRGLDSDGQRREVPFIALSRSRIHALVPLGETEPGEAPDDENDETAVPAPAGTVPEWGLSPSGRPEPDAA